MMSAGTELELEQIDWPAIIRPRSLVVWGQASAEPTSLTGALIKARAQTPAFRAFAGISYGNSVAPELTDRISYTSYCGTGANRSLADQLSILPVPYSRLAQTLTRYAADDLVLLLKLAPGADADHFSFGPGADYAADLIGAARIVIAEVSRAAPRTGLGRDIARHQLDHIVYTDSDCLFPAPTTPADTEAAIAAHVASLIDDGSVIQIGLGSLPEAIMDALHGHQHLGIHSGLLTAGMARLHQAGVITNARKSIDPGLTVAGVLSGDASLMNWADGNTDIRLRPASYTHNPQVLASIDNFIAINSAIEVDLTGQVNAEVAGGRYVGAVGGSGDFLRGAASSNGGVGIIALPSTARGRSRIVRDLSGPVTTARSDVGVVVTEFGIADLRNATLEERKARLLAITHPDHRDLLKS